MTYKNIPLDSLKKIISKIFLFLPLAFLTSACSVNSSNNAASNNEALVNKDKSEKYSNNQLAVEKNIVIDNQRCTGCGKCSRFDAEHFSFNEKIGKAVVISQENLGSNNLSFAISACQDRAIALK